MAEAVGVRDEGGFDLRQQVQRFGGSVTRDQREREGNVGRGVAPGAERDGPGMAEQIDGVRHLAVLEMREPDHHPLFVVDESLPVELADELACELERLIVAAHDRDRDADHPREPRHRFVEHLEADGLDLVDERDGLVVASRSACWR